MITFSNILIESKQTIQKLKQRIKKKDDEEIKRQNLIDEKNNEIATLKEFIESLQNQNKEYNTNNNSILNQSPSNQNIEEEVLQDIKPILNDVEEDNLKEIAGLMKKVMDE